MSDPPGTALAESSAEGARTQAGWILGTLAYISPEQLRGQGLDKRADVWSFGCVLYECLCGRKAFAGRTVSESIRATLAGEPAWELLEGAALPAELERILRRALEKDREARYQSVGELRADLMRLKRDLEEGTFPWARIKPTRTAVVAAVALFLVAAGAWLLVSRPTRAPLRSVPFTSFSGQERHPAFSPDGDQIAFVWNGEREDNFDIYVRPIGSGQARRLTYDPASDWSPTWSPDGRYIAFRRDPAIYIVPTAGGAEQKLVSDVADGASWSPDGEYLAISAQANQNEPASLFRLSLKSGQKTRMTWPPSGSFDNWPVFAPDGRSVAFMRHSSTGYARDIHIVSQGRERRVTSDDREIFGFDWTPDGRQLIFSSGRGGVPSLWRVAATGGSPEAV
ncbi:MAG: protein kinase domain-containing protein, partial [Gammaproteobacteria bacterium]